MDPYILMLVALGVLAIIDLVVGVSNDAVNFLNSAIGSKAFPIKTIMIIASIGVFFGAISSSGMMEVARKGIFNPNMFVFEEIMYIFMAVMITDILLLDIFNSLGMPTSTTVSIVFELLGAAMAIAILKISSSDSESISNIVNYINHTKALQIIGGIILSVVFSFSIGAIVQFFSRLLYTFDFKHRPNYINVLFGGFAITSISFFIVFKGLKGTPFYGNIKDSLESNTLAIISTGLVFCSLLSYIIIKFLKTNILVVIIGLGVFSLAVAFSGNDLVNFIGVPMAALNSYQAWSASGIPATEFSMGILAKKVPSNIYLLLFAGLIMVITLWTSKKAKSVIETEVNLSRQGEGSERFEPNNASRAIVKLAIYINNIFIKLTSKKTRIILNSRFKKPIIKAHIGTTHADEAAFDLVRASVNLVVASILISVATSMKLPLSTTYVSFMVAMGTSLADRAWGRDSAVYRVAGVLSVIAGWFLTAAIAFVAASIVVYFISWTKLMIPVFLIIVAFMLVKNSVSHAKKEKEKKEEEQNQIAEIKNINGIITQSSKHISKVSKRVNKLYTNVIYALEEDSLNKMKKNDKLVAKLNQDIDSLRDGIFFFIKGVDDESSVKASKFYILILGHLQDITQSVNDISKAAYKHINNKHKKLKQSKLNDLKTINVQFSKALEITTTSFAEQDFNRLQQVIKTKKQLLNEVNKSIETQINRICKTDESSSKSTSLYFSILLETQDLITAFIDMIERFEEFNIITKK